ncbi:hypothetical protein EJB05_23153 [Eragrostis curvula]|uniref:Uncharacterized protein n=1 Tax=Eragrostis curvula TaxID=38414 RepID=A0A5J9V7D0_9POAL|nr:hypothetical protein EJB05_23153 [Eragrostis curvula]
MTDQPCMGHRTVQLSLSSCVRQLCPCRTKTLNLAVAETRHRSSDLLCLPPERGQCTTNKTPRNRHCRHHPRTHHPSTAPRALPPLLPP